MAAPGASNSFIVVTGGDAVEAASVPPLQPGAIVIAADSGVEQAQALGWPIAVAVGDFDSVDPAALRAAELAGAVVERHPAAKDATDLELALAAAVARGAQRICVVGGDGGRLDHLLANALLLASPAYADVEVTAVMGGATVTVVRSSAALEGPVGSVVSLLAVGGPAIAVTTDGLLYPLAREDLLPGSTRGVSNEIVASPATVRIDAGVLLAVQPARPLDEENRNPT
jgi:thiamine pyrophosphokinase